MRLLLTALTLFSVVSYSADKDFPQKFPVERIISLAPSSTELVYAAGLGDKLVAVSAYSDYPDQAKALEKVASFESINIERIIALKPDLIVAWRSGGAGKSLKQLEELGFKLYYSDTTYLADIATRIEELSRFSEDPDTGLQNAATFRRELDTLVYRYKDKPVVSYFYQLSSNPVITLAQNHWPSEVFALCGGENILEDAPVAYPQVGIEQVIVRAPEVIFTSPHTVQNTEMWQKWHNQIPAVENQFIWSLNADWINRPTPRSLKAVEQVCQYLDKARSLTK